MNDPKWQVTFRIRRQRTGEKPVFQSYKLEVDPEEYLLDVIERIWAEKDRSLTFRHACHHSTCGACGMRINGREKLTCITTIRSITRNGGIVRVEPLRNFPVISDLVVDMGTFYQKMERAGFRSVGSSALSALPYEKEELPVSVRETERLVDCIECGLCISACPASSTDQEYIGPAVLGALHLMFAQSPDEDLINQADHHTGLWRCHSAYECTQVCPSGVDPAWRIMAMRKLVMSKRIKAIFKAQPGEIDHA